MLTRCDQWLKFAARITTVLCMPLMILVIHSGASCGNHSAVEQDQVSVDQSDPITDTIVYITDTGEKYHRSGCRYLKESKISVSITEAIKQGYEACKVCKPPVQ